MNSKKSRPVKIYLLIGFSLLIATGVLVWRYYKYKLVHNSIQEGIREKTKGLYQVRYDSLYIDEVSGTLHVAKVQLLPDTALFRQMAKEHKSPPVLVTINIPNLDIMRVKTPKALLNKEIEGGKIEVNGASIEIALSDFLRDSTEYSPAKEIYKQILGSLKSIRMDSIQVNHATLIVKDFRSGKTRFTGQDFSFLLTGVMVDSLTKDDSSTILFSKNLALVCKEINIPSEDKRYRFHFEGLGFTSQSDLFSVKKIEIQPQLNEPDFARSLRFQFDRYAFRMESINLSRINRQALWHKRIEADSLSIGLSSFKVFRDMSYPRDSINRVGTYPHQLLMQLPIPVAIKKMIFNKSFIEYKEKNAKSDSSGKVQFYDVHAVISNVTNIRTYIARNNNCVLDFKSRFLNKAVFTARLTMYLKASHGKFSIEGEMGSMPFEDVNHITEPVALARLDKGIIDKLNFHFYGDDYTCSGRMLFLYRDAHLSLLKKDKEENQYKKKGIASFVTNLVIKKSNPSNGNVRYVNPRSNRDINKNIFNAMWLTLFEGLKETAGMK